MGGDVSEFPLPQLTQWPGRFRFIGLVLALAGQRPVDSGLAVDAVLGGLAEEDDELQVFGALVAAGEFGAADWMLGQCPAFDDVRARELSDRLAKERADSKQLLTARLSGLGDQADAAGLQLSLDQDEVESLLLTSRQRAEERLAAAESSLIRQIADKTRRLRERLRTAEDFDPGYRETIAAYLETGRLRTAERILDGTIIDPRPGPEGVPLLPSLEWNRPAETVLDWHLSRDVGAFPSFRPVTEERARAVLAAYSTLRSGGESSAREFAEALDGFLTDADPSRHRVTPQPGGFLTDLHNVFHEPQTSWFPPRRRVRLFVAEPGVTEVPEQLAAQLGQPFIAVGWSLAKPARPGRGGGWSLARSARLGRGSAAILALEDLLRLVLVTTRRQVGLVRLLGSQWPTRMITGETAADLDRQLVSEEQERWTILSWMADLCGLGDTTVADAVAFETGLDSALIWLFFDYLERREELGAEPGPLAPEAARIAVRAWRKDRRMAAEVETAVLSGLAAPQAVVTFWAALSAAEPGQPVPLSDLAVVAAAAAATPGVSDGVSIDWGDEVQAGAAELARRWLVRVGGDDADQVMTLRQCGVQEVLSGIARARLKTACEVRAEQVKHAESQSRRELRLLAFEANRHALSRQLADYEALASDPAASPEALSAARRAMDEETARILQLDPELTGTCDLDPVLTAIVAEFHRTYGDIEVTLEGTPRVTVAVSENLARRVLYELLANAAQAMAELGGGQIEITVDATDDDEVSIHVRDSGPGIEVSNASRKIFRDTYSTRGEGRGLGLYNAQGLARKFRGGDLALEEARSSDPVLCGAHFVLTLPRR